MTASKNEERTDVRRTLDRWILALWLLTAAAMPAALGLVFLYVPDEKVMGAAQRIFYFHVPAAFVTFASALVLLAASAAYLWTRRLAWDNLALSATEIGLLFCSLVLVTGPIWAKAAWQGRISDWILDPKIMTTMILWLLLAASLMVRHAAASRELGARLSAVVGIIAAIDVPIVHKATVWWRGHHPVLFEPGKSAALEPRMRIAFGFSVLVFFLLFGLLLALRYHLADLEDRGRAAVERS